ncbi:hypothetical protein P885DRAFT_64819 [Corynascus similis CBS 632.67]
MRLPPPGPLRDKARKKRILGELVHALTDPLCKVVPNSLGCAEAEPEPEPSPSPDPTPTPTPPAQTSTPVTSAPAQSSAVQAPQPTRNPEPTSSPTKHQPPPPSETGSKGSGGSGSDDGSDSGETDPSRGGSGSSDGNNGSPGSGNNSDHGDDSTWGGNKGGGGNSGGNTTPDGHGNGKGNEGGGGHGDSQDSGNAPPVNHDEDGGSKSGSGSSSGGADEDDDSVRDPSRGETGNDTPTTVGGAAPEKTTPSLVTGDGISHTDWDDLSAGSDASHGSGNNLEDGGSTGDNADGNSQSSSLPGIIGGILAILVLLLVLLALILYKYRRNRRVQSFLNRYTPFKTSAYTDLERKRSSLGAGLLFTDGCHGDALMQETRGALGYGTMLAAAVALPHPAATPRERPVSPPQIATTTLPARRPGSPLSPFEVSPLSAHFPATPPPAVARRTSQDSVGGISIASSGVFSPSLLSWPAPPSAAPSIMTSPPASSQGNLADLAAKYKPMTPTKPTEQSNRTSIPRVSPTPASPSNWQKPPGWD